MLVITGAPGVGKSTIARLVAARHRRSVHIDADQVHQMIINGGQWPSARTAESVRQLVLRTTNVAALAQRFREAGFVPVVDEVLCMPPQLDIIGRTLAPSPLRVDVMLTADREVIMERDAERSKHTAANYPGAQQLVERATRGRAHRIDTTELSVPETVEAVMELLPWRSATSSSDGLSPARNRTSASPAG